MIGILVLIISVLGLALFFEAKYSDKIAELNDKLFIIELEVNKPNPDLSKIRALFYE